MQTKRNARELIVHIKGKKIKSSMAVFMSILILNLNLGCAYYKVRPIEITKENIKTFNEQDKYVIIHSGVFIYSLDQMVFDADNQMISGIASHISEEHLYKNIRGKKSNHNYDRGKHEPFSEVHFYVEEASYPKMGTEISIPFEKITSISVNKPNTGRTIANVALTTVGVFFAAMLIIALTKSSCPFVYVKNGQEYVFAGELYPGVITANMQRDDYLPLPDFIPENGKFKLKITNELKEIQHTDLAQLLVIEHPKNLEILLDKKGNPHTFLNPELPKALSYDGKSQTLKQIKAKDNNYWSFNSITNTPKSTREMVLEFDKPEQSKAAKLYLTAKNSVWLDVVFGKFNEQFGSYYNDFQKKQQTLPKGVSEQWAIDQNIPLSVYLETSKGWKLIDRIATVGPLAMRDMVIPFDIGEVSGSKVKIKLETGFMFWDVGYVAIDYSKNLDLEVTAIEPSLAIDHNNKNVTELLKKGDLKYLVQPNIGDEVLVTYKKQISDEKMAQSYFLKNRGYYNYIRDYEGTPDFMALKSFREKNVFTEFSETSYLNFVQSENLTAQNYE